MQQLRVRQMMSQARRHGVSPRWNHAASVTSGLNYTGLELPTPYRPTAFRLRLREHTIRAHRLPKPKGHRD